jgi:sugar-specific transcriptional regulator TrmB
MDTKILEEIGLTPAEIKVYLALLEGGASTAGKILEKAGIQNSVFHFCVNKLIEKGLVSYIKKGKARIYQAASPENFLVYLKDKEKKIQEILPELKARQAFAKEHEDVELFEGLNGVISMLNKMIENTKKGDEYMFFAVDVDTKNEEVQNFYKRYDTKRKEKGLITKGIAPKKMRHLFEKRTYLKMRYSNLPIPSNSAICNDRMCIILWGEKPKGVLIQSKQIVAKQKEFFNAFWKMIK